MLQSEETDIHVFVPFFIFFRLWAAKKYVDTQRIGVWGWVRDAVSSFFVLSGFAHASLAVVWWFHGRKSG